MRRALTSVASWIVLIILSTVAMLSQQQPHLDDGFKPYGSYDGSNVDSVNLQNGNLILHIAMPFSYPQRGGKLAPKTVLTLNAKSWAVDSHVNVSDGSSVQFWAFGFGRNATIQAIGTGVGLNSTLDLAVHRLITSTTDTTGTQVVAWGHYLTTWDGALHQLHAASNAPLDSTGTPLSFDTIDNSGYHVELSNPDANGIPQAGVVRDRNGNRYSFSKFANLCGRAVNDAAVDFKTQQRVSSLEWENEVNKLFAAYEWPSEAFSPPDRNWIQQLQDNPGPAPGPPGSTTNCVQASVTDSVTDANGNVINMPDSASPGDTLGRPPFGFTGPTSTTDFSGCVSPSAPVSQASIYSFQGVGGTAVQAKVCTANFTIQTNFGISGVVEYQDENTDLNNGLKAVPLIVSVVFLDGADWQSSSVWSFNYDSYLNVTDIGLPAGGAIHYDWTTIQQPNCGGSTPVSRAVSARTVHDGQGNSYVTSYSWGASSSGVHTNTVTDALGNATDHTFTALDGTNGCRFYETSTKQYQGSGSGRSLLQQVDTAYLPGTVFTDATGANGGTGNFLPSTITTTLAPSNKVRQVVRSYDQGPGNTRPIFGNVVTEKETDWGSGTPGPLLRQTETAFEWQQTGSSGSQPYLQANLADLPARTVVKDGGGCMVSESVFGYDETPVISSTLGAAQHLTAPPNSVRGNSTSVSRWSSSLSSTNCVTAPLPTDAVAAPSPAITTHSQWFDSGTLANATDALGNRTTYGYDTNTYQGAYQTQTTDALNHSVSGTYDFTTGLMTSFTDQNGTTMASGNTPGDPVHTWSYTYDPVRFLLTDAKAPDGAHTKFQYSAPNISPTTVDILKDIDSSRQDHSTHVFDGIGRAFKTVHVSANNTTVLTTFDGLNHVASVTNPYFSISDPTYGVTQTQYDALGRVIKVIKQDGSFSTMDYSQGNCAVTTDESSRQRQSCSDGLGHLVEVDEPNPSSTPTHATGSITISGSEQQSQTALPGSGTVTVTGAEDSVTICPNANCFLKWNTGSVTLTVNGFSKSVSYGRTDTPSTVAANFVSAFSADGNSPVNVSASGSALTLTARTAGSATNYALSSSSTTDDPSDFDPAFALTNGAALTGGQDAISTPDSGTINVTINGITYGTTYAGGDSTALLAARIATLVGNDGLASASVSGGTINLSSKDTGSSTNYSLSAAVTQNSGYAHQSFAIAALGSTLTGGYNAGDLKDAPLVTLYSYDGLGNLLTVTQKGGATDSTLWRNRYFTYDSLSRLLRSNNPEAGATTYTYDDAGNLVSRTDARGITTTHSYDALHRLLGKTYSNGDAPEAFYYDSYAGWAGGSSVGKLVKTSKNGGHYFTYDVMGRITSTWQCLPSDCAHGASISAQYNLAGDMTQFTYPDGRAVAYSFNGANQLNQVQLTQLNGASVSAYNYYAVADGNFHPTGVPKLVNFGNGVTESYQFNTRLQPSEDTVSALFSGNTMTFADHVYKYTSQNVTGNNGNIMSVVDNLNSGRTQSFAFDLLNRLISGNEGRWGLSFVHDPWGNFLQQNVTAGSANSHSHAVNARNQFVDLSYDADGNTLNDGFHNYTYDAENRIAQVDTTGATYTYDGDGNRLRKDTPGGYTEYVHFGAEIVAEHQNNCWTDYIFAGGKRIAKADCSRSEISVQGTNTAAGQYTWWQIGGAPTVPVSAGDKLYILQNQQGSAAGGIILTFTDGSNSSWGVQDQVGYYANVDHQSAGWHTRILDLTQYAGKSINSFQVGNSSAAPVGSWTILYAEIVLVKADGTVYPIYNGQASATLSLTGNNTPGVTGLVATTITDSSISSNPLLAQQYYHGDQIGSSRLLTSGGGWPTWQGTYLPFGEEYVPQAATNHYKFSGKERDAESGLDYFGARYYSSSMGRWLSSDWSAVPVPVPYADLRDPQSLNLYAYVRNNPVVRQDPDGHDCNDTGQTCPVTTDPKAQTMTISTTVSSDHQIGPLVDNGDGTKTIKETWVETTVNETISTAKGNAGEELDITKTEVQVTKTTTITKDGHTPSTIDRKTTANNAPATKLDAQKAFGPDTRNKFLQAFREAPPSFFAWVRSRPAFTGGTLLTVGGTICAAAEPCGIIAGAAITVVGGVILWYDGYNEDYKNKQQPR